MKKFTKKQRHEVYKKAVKLLDCYAFGCHTIAKVLGLPLSFVTNEYIIEHFPELWKCRRTHETDSAFLSDVEFPVYSIESKNQKELMFMLCIEMTR